MKISETIHIIALCIVSYTQCMQITQPQETNPLTLRLDDNLITQLTNSGKKNKSSPLLFQRQTKRLSILQQLLNHKATINFSNKSKTLIVYRNKNNKEMVQTLLYEKLLYFITCNIQKYRSQINHRYYDQEGSFVATIEVNLSQLHIFAQSLTDELNTLILQFSNQYSFGLSAKQKLRRIHNNYQQSIINRICYHNQNNTDEDDAIDFNKLPKSTQWVVQEILDDMDQDDIKQQDSQKTLSTLLKISHKNPSSAKHFYQQIIARFNQRAEELCNEIKTKKAPVNNNHICSKIITEDLIPLKYKIENILKCITQHNLCHINSCEKTDSNPENSPRITIINSIIDHLKNVTDISLDEAKIKNYQLLINYITHFSTTECHHEKDEKFLEALKIISINNKHDAQKLAILLNAETLNKEKLENLQTHT